MQSTFSFKDWGTNMETENKAAHECIYLYFKRQIKRWYGIPKNVILLDSERKMAATYRSRNSTAKPADVLKISSPCIFLTYNQLCLYWNFFLSLLSQHLKNIFGLWHFEKRRCIISSSEETALLRALVRTVLAADSPILKPCFEQLITTVCVELVFSLLKHFHSPLSVSF